MLRRHHQGGGVWLWAACAFVVAAAGAVPAEGAAESHADRLAMRPVAVEALGFALMGPGVTQGQAHAAALTDARRNALVQAHATLEAETVVARMRVAAELVRVSSAGYVQEMHVLEAGVMQDTDPPVYRVRVRALVHPLDETRAGAGATLEAQLTPVVALEVSAPDGPDLYDALAEELTRCGMRVVRSAEGEPAIVARVAVLETVDLGGPGFAWWQAGLKDDGESALKVRWLLLVGPAAADAAAPASGQSLLPTDAAVLPRALPHLSVTMAQSALRLWVSRRTTRVRFVGATEADTRALKAVARDLALPPSDVPEPPVEGMLLHLRVAGNPLVAVESVLHRAGLKDRFVAGEVSLTDLTYVRVPEPADAAEAEAQ